MPGEFSLRGFESLLFACFSPEDIHHTYIVHAMLPCFTHACTFGLFNSGGFLAYFESIDRVFRLFAPRKHHTLPLHQQSFQLSALPIMLPGRFKVLLNSDALFSHAFRAVFRLSFCHCSRHRPRPWSLHLRRSCPCHLRLVPSELKKPAHLGLLPQEVRGGRVKAAKFMCGGQQLVQANG